jgi:3-hydroxyisobutyrate dehydrogenase
MRIGVAGLGAMGGAIAARLMEAGHQVTVWNRTAAKVKPLAEAGAEVADSPAAVAAASEGIITILTDGAAIEAVYHGPSGLLSGDVTGKLFIEMSTVPAGAARQAAWADGRRACRRGARQADPRPALPQG